MKKNINSKASLVYARALFGAAKESDLLDIIRKDVLDLTSILEQDSGAIYSLLSSPVVDQMEKKSIVLKIFNKKINDLLFNFLNLLITKNRFSNVFAIFDLYISMIDDQSGLSRGEIRISNIPDSENSKKIVDSIQKILNKKVSLDFVQDKNLVAGFSAKVGSYTLEYSFETHLKQIEKKLIRG